MQQTFSIAPVRVRRDHPLWRARVTDLACALFAAVPLALTAHIPLYDLPNHIAMLHVLLDGATTLPLSHIYGVHWAFVPNMGLQVLAFLLSPLLSVEASVRLFCVLTVLLLCVGTRALSLALSEGNPGPRLYRLAPLLVWGGPMQFGFISYCFGCALMLWALALYVRVRAAPVLLVVAVFAPICVGLLAAHLMAVGLFLAAVAGLELTETLLLDGPPRQRIVWLLGRAAMVGVIVLPAAALLLLMPSLRSGAAPNFQAAASEGFSLFFKAQSVAAVTWFAMPIVEVPLLVASAVCAGVAILLGWIRLQARMVGIVVILGLVWLVLPRGITASFYVDYRVPWAISFIVLAGLVPGAAVAVRGSDAARYAMGCLLVALVGVRVASISLRWLDCEPELAAMDDALARLPEGSSLWVVRGRLPGQVMKTPPLEHAAADIVTLRDGFENEVFAGAAGQMVYLKPAYLPLYRMEAAHDLLGVPAGYDAVLVLFPALVRRAPGLGLRQVAAGPHFALWRVAANHG